MSLIDILITIVDHPVTQKMSPLVQSILADRQDQRKLEIERETLTQWRTLNASTDPIPDSVLAVAGVAGTATAMAPPAAATPAKGDDLYAAGNRYDVGCAVCGKAHLAATVGMLDRAASLAQERGRCDDDCTYYVSAAQREVVNLVGYDWTPAAIAATPDGERRLLEKWAPQVESLNATLFQGTEAQARINLAKAAGALEEAGRFARADGVTHPEAQQRMADAEALLAETERGEWSPERRHTMDAQTRAVVDQALPAFRKQRQFLINGIQSPEDLDRVAAEVGTLNKQLQAVAVQTLTPDQIAAMADQVRTVREGFRADLTAYQQQGGTVV